MINEQHAEQSTEVTVQAGKVTLDGDLSVPDNPVVFAHGSGSSRFISRNRVWCKYSNEPYDIVIRQYYG